MMCMCTIPHFSLFLCIFLAALHESSPFTPSTPTFTTPPKSISSSSATPKSSPKITPPPLPPSATMTMMPLGIPRVPYYPPSTSPSTRPPDWLDLPSLMNLHRLIFINEELTPRYCNTIIAQLLYMDSNLSNIDEFASPSPSTSDKNNKPNYQPINIYISSPGGSVSSGLSLHDILQTLKSPINTINIGTCSSMASFILASGGLNGGKRYTLKNSRVMIHEPTAHGVNGFGGQAEDLKREVKEVMRIRNMIYSGYKKMMKLTDEEVMRLFNGEDKNGGSGGRGKGGGGRERWMDPKEALEWGVVDEII